VIPGAWGTRFRIELFGASHAPEVGVVVDGVPAGTPLDVAEIQRMLDRRRPVGRSLASRRRETDPLVVDSGIENGRATGEPIRAHVPNLDVRRSDYDALRNTPRPGHADYPARVRFGPAADLSGGGIFSGRMTIGLVIGGAVAQAVLRPLNLRVAAFCAAIGPHRAEVPASLELGTLVSRRDANEVGCPDATVARAMAREISAARRAGDSVGGVVEARCVGVPVGLGEPFFDSLESVLAHLALSIPGAKGVEFGDGFRASQLHGSENNDPYAIVDGHIRTRTNHAGGILGGLATGMPIVFRVAFKPTPSIAREQESVDLETLRPARIRIRGRHDPCFVPRAVVVVEAIASLALAELALRGGFLP
jgi:chorismate synthase